MTQIDHRIEPGAEKIWGGHRKPALQIFQKVNVIALESGGFGKASRALSPRGERDGLIVQGRLCRYGLWQAHRALNVSPVVGKAFFWRYGAVFRCLALRWPGLAPAGDLLSCCTTRKKAKKRA
ncbi:hypothetical protein, partial [Zoogloea sp.]|uniref:hypothetical protein n=1 Tax=Zoogloea sp. TaxID=49181 RepID=UPI0025FF4258